MLVTDAEHEIIEREISKLLQKGIIVKVSHKKGQILSSIFLRPKKDGTHTLILNLKRFNESVTHHHFKMDSLFTITKLITRHCYMASLDLKDAYYSVPVCVEHRNFSRFLWENQIYEVSCAPRIFSKLLKPPLSRLHKLGHISVAYLDDIYLRGQSLQGCVANVIGTIVLLSKLAFVIHPEKSCPKPTQTLTILGFPNDSVTMTIRLTFTA